MKDQDLCLDMKLLQCGTKALVAGAVVGAVGFGLYRAIQTYYCNDNEASDPDEDLRIDLQSLVNDCCSQGSLALELDEDRKLNTVIEVPVDFKALAMEDQNVTLQIKAKNNICQNATTKCYIKGQRKNTSRKIDHESEVTEVKHRISDHPHIVIDKRKARIESSQQLESDSHGEEMELFETESIKRLDGAINEVNYMLQRLGGMLEKTRVDFATRRSSLMTRDHRGAERFINF